MDKLNKAIVSLIGVCIMAVVSFAVKAWVLSAVWAWFIVPVGLPAIGVAHAVGIMLTYSAIRGLSHADMYAIKQDKEKPIARMFSHGVIAPMIVYACALIAHSFM